VALPMDAGCESMEARQHSGSPSWREDDNFVRLYDPNVGKGKELYQYLESVNEEGAGLRIVGKEIIVEGFQY